METMKKKIVLQKLGYIVHEMWYCDYKSYNASKKVVEEPLRI